VFGGISKLGGALRTPALAGGARGDPRRAVVITPALHPLHALQCGASVFPLAS